MYKNDDLSLKELKDLGSNPHNLIVVATEDKLHLFHLSGKKITTYHIDEILDSSEIEHTTEHRNMYNSHCVILEAINK